MPAQDVTLYGYFRKPVESIVVNDGNSSITIKEDKTEFIHIFVNGESSSTDGVEFKSNDESIVKVDENGKLTPVRTGETTVTVKSKDNEDIQVTIRVVVEKYKVTYKYILKTVYSSFAALARP